MRRATSVTGRVAMALAGAQRSMVIFSEQSPILQANQTSRGSPSNLWIESWEVPRIEGKPRPKDPNPTILTIEKQLELFNLGELAHPVPDVVSLVHMSYATRRPYGKSLQLELENRAVQKGYTSKVWLTRGMIKKENLTLMPTARPVVVLTVGKVEVLHASQIVMPKGEHLQYIPVSGGSRRLYRAGTDYFRLLRENAKSNGYSSGLYFSTKQLEALGLEAAAGAVPIELEEVKKQDSDYMYYNVEQLENPKQALQSLNRGPVDVPTFLLTGEEIKCTAALPAHKEMYWLSGRDANMYGLVIREEEAGRGVSLSRQPPRKTALFNVDQLSDPAAGYAKAGLLTK